MKRTIKEYVSLLLAVSHPLDSKLKCSQEKFLGRFFFVLKPIFGKVI